MRSCRLHHAWPLALVVVLALATGLRADLFSTTAFDNATVQPGGPRPGVFGREFFNMEGSASGTFASYGVADLDSTQLGIDFTVDSIASVTIALTQANASFTANGMIDFWITVDTATDIQPDTSPLIYDTTDDPDGIGAQLTSRFFLGSGSFTQSDDGMVDTFTFGLSDDAQAYLASQINAGGVIRVIVSPADETVAATYAGYTHPTFSGPQIIVDAYPAPQ
jgi:hypothetical protein